MTVLAFDPGVTTGVMVVSDKYSRYGWYHLDTLMKIYQYLWDYRPAMVLYEDFKHRPQMMKAELASVEVIGVIKLWLQHNQETAKSWHCLPAEGKAFWSNEKIKALGLWQPGMTHAMDATRIYLTWRQKTDPEWFSQVVRTLR